MGILESDSGAYALRPECAGALLPGTEQYLGPLLTHDLWHWTSWAFLDRSIRSGAAHRERSHDPHLGNHEVLARFLPNFALAMEQTARESVKPLADCIEALDVRSVLDLGGGSGTLLLAVLEHCHGARGTLADRSFALERARELAALHACRDRLTLVELDFERDPLPLGHDLIVLSRILMGLPEMRARLLLERVAEALEPGGYVLVHDYDATSRVGSVLSVDMLLHCGSKVHGRREVTGWFSEIGLELVSDERLLPYTRVYLGVKR
jgi:SAM-dependent methyltransferase